MMMWICEWCKPNENMNVLGYDNEIHLKHNTLSHGIVFSIISVILFFPSYMCVCVCDRFSMLSVVAVVWIGLRIKWRNHSSSRFFFFLSFHLFYFCSQATKSFVYMDSWFHDDASPKIKFTCCCVLSCCIANKRWSEQKQKLYSIVSLDIKWNYYVVNERNKSMRQKKK